MIQENPQTMKDDLKFYSFLSFISLIFLLIMLLTKNYSLTIYPLLVLIWFNIKIEIINSRLHNNEQYEIIAYNKQR